MGNVALLFFLNGNINDTLYNRVRVSSLEFLVF